VDAAGHQAPTVTVGVPDSAARRTPPWSCRLNPTVAEIELAVTPIVEPPMQHVVPHALTASRTLGSVTWAESPPGASTSELAGASQRSEPAL
jgi:hypothetical protein